MRHRAALAALCLALLCCGARAQAPALSASDVWVRATPGSEVAAAYLTLHNGGPQPIVITGVRSARAAQAMIHESSVAGGHSRMRPRQRLRVGAGETLRLAPGGLHVMLQGLTRPLTPGEEVPLLLLLEGGASLAVTAHVRALGED
ncbi:MAG TPA: copper chaperone PCu(A)C [Steroidobacteraceae bacterium]|nr:copper chaperone PCu(A)C [Steroidobacteraceae bacterium]